MKKHLSFLYCTFLCASTLFAQENNPLINSGETIDEAVKLHDAGKYKEAIALYKKINRSDTNYVRALYEASLSYTADSQFNAALQACRWPKRPTRNDCPTCLPNTAVCWII
jgi:hypothetical protein